MLHMTRTALRKRGSDDSLEAINELIDGEADEDRTVVELLRCESSPIYASRPSSTVNKRVLSTGESQHRDHWLAVEHNLRVMDEQNEAAFTDWIRNERNLSLSLPHLKRVMFEYGMERIINGLRWLILEWRLASIAAAIKYLLVDDFWLSPSSGQTAGGRECLCVAGVRYLMSIGEFRARIRIIMALIDGWNFVHVKELFHFLCTSTCTSADQSVFLIRALLLAFPSNTTHASHMKTLLIQAFSQR